MNRALQLSKLDNVATCLTNVKQGDTVNTGTHNLTATQNIPKFHKIAVAPIPAGSHCYKYGEVIGIATQNIQPGQHVHVHNIESTRGRGDKEHNA